MRLKAREDRATDACIGEAMGSDRYKVEMNKLRHQKSDLDRRDRELDQRQQLEQHSRNALDHIDRFCRQVTQGLDALAFEEREQLLKLLVEKVTVDDERARIETVIPTGPDNLRNPRGEPVEPQASARLAECPSTNFQGTAEFRRSSFFLGIAPWSVTLLRANGRSSTGPIIL